MRPTCLLALDEDPLDRELAPLADALGLPLRRLDPDAPAQGGRAREAERTGEGDGPGPALLSEAAALRLAAWPAGAARLHGAGPEGEADACGGFAMRPWILAAPGAPLGRYGPGLLRRLGWAVRAAAGVLVPVADERRAWRLCGAERVAWLGWAAPAGFDPCAAGAPGEAEASGTVRRLAVLPAASPADPLPALGALLLAASLPGARVVHPATAWAARALEETGLIPVGRVRLVRHAEEALAEAELVLLAGEGPARATSAAVLVAAGRSVVTTDAVSWGRALGLAAGSLERPEALRETLLRLAASAPARAARDETARARLHDRHRPEALRARLAAACSTDG